MRIAASAEAVERLARRLGLPGPMNPQRGLHLAAAEGRGDMLRLTLKGPGVPGLLLELEPARPGSPAFLRRGGQQVSFRLEALEGEARPTGGALEILVRGLAQRLLGLAAGEAREVLRLDQAAAQPGMEPAPGPGTGTPGQALNGWQPNPPGGLPLPELEVPWSRFLADARHARDLYSALRLDVSVTHVVHADAECLNESPVGRLVRRPFVVHPWERHRLHLPDSPGLAEPRRVALTTDVGDLEVITGTLPGLQRLLDQVAASVDTDVVIVSNSCVPNIIGDDIDAAVERFRCACPRPVVYSDQKDAPHDERLLALIEQLAAQADGAGGPPAPRPGTVALLGLHDARGREELAGLLAEAGVPVQACLVPEVSARLLLAARQAQVVVRPPRGLWGSTCEELAARLPGQALELAPPYGVAGSRAWLLAVAGAPGREAQAREAWQRAWQALEPEWQALRVRAAGARLGFVLEEPAARCLLESGGLAALPVLEVALEAGFGVDLAVAGACRGPGELERLVASRTARGADLRLHLVPDEAALARQWDTQRPDAVLSEFYRDERLETRGIGRFSLADLELGPQGALRTAERLLSACRLPFLTRYRAYLGEPHD
jgi:hypothetical protein